MCAGNDHEFCMEVTTRQRQASEERGMTERERNRETEREREAEKRESRVSE